MTWEPGQAPIGASSPYIDWWWWQEDPSRRELFDEVDVPVLSAEPPAIGTTPSTPIWEAKVPVPRRAKNPASETDPWDTQQVRDKVPSDLPSDTVITAIIDTGVALGHRRFRDETGASRILAAWQQTATFGGQSYMPFGQELYVGEINNALAAFSHDGTLMGRLEEDAFNRELRLVEPLPELGHRDLDYRAAHGTHVADLAAGIDPFVADPDILRANPMIVVNLPPQSLHGSAGNFLAFWALFAVKRILLLADAINQANAATAPDGGFPLVINFSYGMQAGPKDGRSQLEQALEKLLQDYQAGGKTPARLVMPAGNANQERCAARAFMGGGDVWTGHDGDRNYKLLTELNIPWRVLPQDHTSNFVEIWAYGLDRAGTPPDPGAVTLCLIPPGGTDCAQAIPPLQRGEYATLGDFARVYCRGDGSESLGYVICLAPTERLKTGHPVAAAGLWTIRMIYENAPINATFFVQSDQSGVRHSRNGRQSYFDHSAYKTHMPNGFPRDSYDYHTQAHTDAWNLYGPVQIKGTQNALATTESVVAVGGYRESDGAPTLYSSTADGKSRRGGRGREIIDAVYPSETAPSLFGLLASGSRDGSVVSFRGTSMAAALATRDIVEAFRTTPGERHRIGSANWVRDRARAYQSNRPKHFNYLKMLKGGVGHLRRPATARTTRIDRTG